MGYQKIEPGRRYYCETVAMEATLRGTFCIAAGDIRLSLVRFDEFLHVDADQPVRVRTEKGWFASMFETIDGGSSSSVGSQSVYRCDIVSNVTLVGADLWGDADLVRRVTFRVPGADPLFQASPVYSAVIDAEMGEADTILFRMEREGEAIEGWLALAGGMSSSRPTSADPWLSVHFAQGCDLTAMRHAVTDVVRFFSACAGVELRAESITVSRYPADEMRARASRREPTPDHSVFYYWGAEAANRNCIEPYRTLIDLQTEGGREALEVSLGAWREREHTWSGANAMMLASLADAHVMSAERLLSAMRWLEETPGAKASGAVDRLHAKALSKLIGKWSERLGYRGLAGRFKGAVALIALESNRDRFSRLVGEIRARFGREIVGDDMVGWLVEATRMRGPAAHGARTGIDDEQEVFTIAVRAAECAAILLMLKDLPLSSDAVAQARRHILVQGYRQTGFNRTPAMVRHPTA